MINTEPLISIIIPVYNVEEYLPKCLGSVLSQTYKNIEIICVNDGSTDGSEEILRSYSERDNRIVVISKLNEGGSIARNCGLDKAKGDYIMFVDSDDWIEKNTCEVAINTLLKYKVDVVLWDYIREFNNKSLTKNIYNTNIYFDTQSVKTKLHRRMIGIYGDELSHPEKADAICTIWGKLYKRSCIYDKNIRFFDIREIGSYEDGLFNMQVFENINSAIYIHKYLYHYRKDNANSVTKIYRPNLVKQHEKILDIMDEYINKNNLPMEYKIALSNRTALELLGYGLNIMNLDKNKLSSIKSILLNDRYIKAYRQLDIKYMPIYWKVFYLCAKIQCSLGIYVLLIFIKRNLRA